MKGSRFSDNQIMEAVKRFEAGISYSDICRRLGISTERFYKWPTKYGSMDVSTMLRMKELEEENRRLKKMSDQAIALNGHYVAQDYAPSVSQNCTSSSNPHYKI